MALRPTVKAAENRAREDTRHVEADRRESLLIPGTSRVEHLKENLAAGGLVLPEVVVARLNGLGA